jgi:crotonobetainyl-CoA:carnitine CoA-transferase CaiB-like acyl-CoA transferase
MTTEDLARLEALTAIIRESFTKSKAAKAEEALSLLMAFTVVSGNLNHADAIVADRQAASRYLRKAAKARWDTTSQALHVVALGIESGDHAA